MMRGALHFHVITKKNNDKNIHRINRSLNGAIHDIKQRPLDQLIEMSYSSCSRISAVVGGQLIDSYFM
jgi:hypothetical protein